jgi:hypothetical protein
MFKMSTRGVALLLAGLGACSNQSGLKSRAGDGGVASGGQAGSTISSGTTGGTAASGGTMAQGGRTASGGSADQGGNGGVVGAGGASSSSSGNSCYDSSGTIATTAKTCTLASDCKQVVEPTCCGAISEVGLAKSSSCTFPTPSCENLSCPTYTSQPEQAEDGKNTLQGGTVVLECVSGQCMTFVMAGGVDAATNVDTVAPSCFVAASDYDQSCSADSDCVRVDFGNYCQWICRCGGDAINIDSLSQFTADTAMTPLAQGSIPGVCSCGSIFGPCCRGGQCTTGTACGADAE